MIHGNRDLWVLINQDLMSEQDLQLEVCRINNLLKKVETTEFLSHVCELIDLNRYCIHSKAHVVRDYLRSRKSTPFVFVFNRN